MPIQNVDDSWPFAEELQLHDVNKSQGTIAPNGRGNLFVLHLLAVFVEKPTQHPSILHSTHGIWTWIVSVWVTQQCTFQVAVKLMIKFYFWTIIRCTLQITPNVERKSNINQTAAKSQGCAQDPSVPTPPKSPAPASKGPTPPGSLPNATIYTIVSMEFTCLAPATTSSSYLDIVSPTTSTVAMELTQPFNTMIHTRKWSPEAEIRLSQLGHHIFIANYNALEQQHE